MLRLQRHSSGAIAGIAWCLLATVASAQGPEPLRQPASIPVELAIAIVSAGGFGAEGDPQILVGAVPEWVAARIAAPAGARVLGSAFLGTSVVAVFEVPTASETVLGDAQQELHKRGWQPPPPPPTNAVFRPAPSSSNRPARRFTLCRENQVLSSWISKQRALATTIVMRVSNLGTVGLCNPPQVPRDSSHYALPILYSPGEATDRIGQECMRVDVNTYGTYTNVRTTLSPEAVLEHYGRQLRDSGWTAASITPKVATRSWARPDSAGVPAGDAPVVLVISVTAPDTSSCRDVSLQLGRRRMP